MFRLSDGEEFNTGDSNLTGSDGSGGSDGGGSETGGNLTVQEVSGNGGQVNTSVPNVTTIQFDNNTGFNVTDNGDGEVLIDHGSSFADIYVSGQTTLEATGEDSLEFIAGTGIKLTTTTTHSGSATKAITITATSDAPGSILVIDASDNSPELDKFLDLLNNPCNYKGRVVYLTAVGPTPRPDPFLWPDKFYFNEGCEWHESPFALGAILNDL